MLIEIANKKSISAIFKSLKKEKHISQSYLQLLVKCLLSLKQSTNGKQSPHIFSCFISFPNTIIIQSVISFQIKSYRKVKELVIANHNKSSFL